MTFFDGFKHHRAAAMLQQVRTGGGRLDHRAIRREVAAEHSDPGIRFDGLREAANHIAVPARSLGDILPDRFSVRSQRISPQNISFTELAKYSRQSSGIEEVF